MVLGTVPISIVAKGCCFGAELFSCYFPSMQANYNMKPYDPTDPKSNFRSKDENFFLKLG